MALDGIIAKKIGMTQIFNEDGTVESVTAVQAGPCLVTQIKTSENDGYSSVQLGFEEMKKNIGKPREGHLRITGLTDTRFRFLREIRTSGDEDIEIGQQIDVGMFEAGDLITAMGNSKGRGFAGGVKRHGFAGGPKTHGQSDRHRAPGSIGAGTSPGRVLKGLKMAGHMGNAQVTVKNLEIIQSDLERNLLFIKGAVPGARNGLLVIKKIGHKRG